MSWYKNQTLHLHLLDTAFNEVEFQGYDKGAMVKELEVLDFDTDDIAGFGPFDVERPREVVHAGEVNIFDTICGVVVLDLSACLVYAFDF